MTTVALNDLNHQIFEISWPINSIFITTSDNNPSTIITGGENSVWEKIQDRFLLASGSTYVNGSIGGEAAHTLTEAEMPNHFHDSLRYQSPDGGKFGCNPGGLFDTNWQVPWVGGQAQDYYYTGRAGGSQPHNNMPPYLVVNVWKRIQ